jgi:hypothetical protein
MRQAIIPRRCALRAALVAPTTFAVITLYQQPLKADEGGVSFWTPGTFASFAAIPAEPGWSFSTTYFHTSVEGGSNVATADTLPRFPRTTLSFALDANIKTNVDLAILTPGYTFQTPVFGGRLALNVYIPVGRAQTQIDSNVMGALGPIGFGAQNSVSDSLTAFGDPAPQLSLKWKDGMSNFMVYGRGGIPVGDYNADRIVNLGRGHGALDNGVGYTYFNSDAGYEFSAVSGLTYNFENPHTNYRNGVDWHLDWAASRFLSKQFFVGPVGYVYNQLTGDSGSGATLGEYKSRIAAVGPQLGAVFPLAEMQGSLSLRGYWEFGAENRSAGWNTWLVFSVAPAEKPLTPIE